MIRITFKVQGKFDKELAKFKARLGRRVQKGMMTAADYIYHRSQVLVPRDSNYLAETGRITPIGSFPDFMVVIGYGGTDWPPSLVYSDKEQRIVTRYPAAYVVYVHENANLKHDPGQQHEFLATPVRAELSETRLAFGTAFVGMT